MILRALRGGASALAAASVLLTGCAVVGASEDASLTRKQVRAIVPDPEVMPGWQTSWKPRAVRVDESYTAGCNTGNGPACVGGRYHGSARFSRHELGVVTFLVLSYETGKQAEEAYDPFWGRHRVDGLGWREIDLADLGDRAEARAGGLPDPEREGAVIQVRVGTTLLTTTLKGPREGGLDDAGVADLAEMLTERARQAHSGEDPSAGLPD